MGVTAAICSVKQDFEVNVDKSSVQIYLNNLLARGSNTHLLISVKGTHHLLNAAEVQLFPKGGSLIKLICLYTETLQGG